MSSSVVLCTGKQATGRLYRIRTVSICNWIVVRHAHTRCK